MIGQSLNVILYKELSQSLEFRTIVDELGLIPVEWGDAYFSLKEFKKNSLSFEGIVPLSQREKIEIIENYFYKQLELF